MPIEKGQDEYRALTDALEQTRPPCHGDWRYIQDRHELDDGDVSAMQRVCRVCPLRDICSAYARAAKPSAGMWAGRYWGRKERATT